MILQKLHQYPYFKYLKETLLIPNKNGEHSIIRLIFKDEKTFDYEIPEKKVYEFTQKGIEKMCNDIYQSFVEKKGTNELTTKIKLGRPEKDIDWTLFEQLCAIQCTHEELALMLKVSRETLTERAKKKYPEMADFPTIYKTFISPGKCSLRRDQFKLSKKNAGMAIWLGKQYLDQKDNKEDQPDKQITINVKNYSNNKESE